MNVRDKDVELHAAFTSLSEHALPAGDCPSSERLWDAANGALAPGETGELIDHTSTCGACAEAWRLARELRPPESEVDKSGGRAWYWGAAAVAVAAALLLFVMTRSTRTTAPGIERGNETSAIVPTVAEGTELARDRFLLSWRAKARPIDYQLELFTARMEILYTAEGIVQARHTVPASALAKTPPHSQLYWRVTARLADGKRVASRVFLVIVE